MQHLRRLIFVHTVRKNYVIILPKEFFKHHRGIYKGRYKGAETGATTGAETGAYTGTEAGAETGT